MTFQYLIIGSINNDICIINHFLRKVKLGNASTAGHQSLLTRFKALKAGCYYYNFGKRARADESESKIL
jgi:hypothetical protein